MESKMTTNLDFINEKLIGVDGFNSEYEWMVRRLWHFSNRLTDLVDMSTVLDAILTEVRSATKADAGTIYIVEQGQLRFAHVQNDTLFKSRPGNVHNYENVLIPIGRTSVVGYAASTREMVNIPDVENISPDVPYRFNRSFDEANGYKTVSILTVPVVRLGGDAIGVIQLINSKTEDGTIQPFSEQSVTYAELLSIQALAAIERAMTTHRLIERMIQMVSLHDPLETGCHAQRVGAYAAEIYNRWAENHDVPASQIRDTRDKLRLAAMLHDIGKIAVPGTILKKPSRLTRQERHVMQAHCVLGASIYSQMRNESPLEEMAYMVTLHHHQKWDGTGYTGSADVPVLKGGDIPLTARVVAAADVLDALTSQRCYKDAWPFNKSFEEIARLSGTHFDPEVVRAVMEIRDTILAVSSRYQDE